MISPWSATVGATIGVAIAITDWLELTSILPF